MVIDTEIIIRFSELRSLFVRKIRLIILLYVVDNKDASSIFNIFYFFTTERIGENDKTGFQNFVPTLKNTDSRTIRENYNRYQIC